MSPASIVSAFASALGLTSGIALDATGAPVLLEGEGPGEEAEEIRVAVNGVILVCGGTEGDSAGAGSLYITTRWVVCMGSRRGVRHCHR
jgi:hypothetical protein